MEELKLRLEAAQGLSKCWVRCEDFMSPHRGERLIIFCSEASEGFQYLATHNKKQNS